MKITLKSHKPRKEQFYCVAGVYGPNNTRYGEAFLKFSKIGAERAARRDCLKWHGYRLTIAAVFSEEKSTFIRSPSGRL